MANVTDYAVVSRVVEKVYDDLESERVANAVKSCLRIARMLRDPLSTAVFHREIWPHKTNFSDVLLDDFGSLSKKTFEYVYEQSSEIWLRNHTLRESFLKGEDGKERNIFALGIGEIEAELRTAEEVVNDLQVPPGMSEYDTAAFWHNTREAVAMHRARIKGVREVREKISSYCLNYAIGIERQLSAQQGADGFFQGVLTEVNNYFAAESESVYAKLRKSLQLVSSEDAEDGSLLLTSVRRCLMAVADHFYPPSAELVTCSDGKQRKLGPEQYLNRLEEFLSTEVPSSSRDLLKQECQVLAGFARRLNDVASKGVHSDVASREAKQGLLGVYLFLFNLISLLRQKEGE